MFLPTLVGASSPAADDGTGRSQGHVGVQMLLLGLVFNLIAVACDRACGGAGSGDRPRLVRPLTRRLSLVGGIGGLTMIGLGVTVAATGRKD